MRWLFLFVCCLLAATAAVAVPDRGLPASEVIERFVITEAGTATVPVPGARIEVEVGRLDPRLRLTACGNIEPFVPPGTRLWGRARVGLRCLDSGPQSTRWQVFLPVSVRVFGPALVPTRPLAAGQPIAADDLASAEVEWTREPQGVVTDISQIEGRVASRPVGAGQPIALAALRAPQVLAAGEQVRVVGRGKGFAITAQAVALAAAQDGQSVRVRLDSGRIVTGTARAGRWVELAL
jgi:flagella basal body P-ring formation protein FlgA